MKKVGMNYEGTLKRNFIEGDTFRDSIMYAILKEKWHKRLEVVD